MISMVLTSLCASLLHLGAAWAGPVLLPQGGVDAARADRLFEGRRFVLAVGPAAFADPAFAPLRYTDDDANAVAEALSDPELGAFDRVWTLTRPEDTTLRGVRAALAQIRAAATSPNDTIVLYFSTHGTLARGPAGRLDQYLVLSDSRMATITTTGILQDEILDWLERLPSRRRVAIFAACHSGQGKSALSDDTRLALANTKGRPLAPLHTVSEATVVIGACALDETALESEKLGHDVYTAFWLRALHEGDRDGDGAVSVTEAHAFAREGAWTFTEGGQRAWVRAEVLGEDPIVLAGKRRAAASPSVASYRDVFEGYRLWVDGTDKGALPGEVVLEPGRHRVELRSAEGQLVAWQSAEFPAGRRVELESLLGRDSLRLLGGAGAAAYTIGPETRPILYGELHLPSLLGGAWETVGQGSVAVTWPRPTLSGGIVVERAVISGPWQLRAGGGLQAWLLREREILAPSLTPTPVLSAAWVPDGVARARLALSGGMLWYTDAGRWHVGGTGQLTLAVGFGG